MLVDPTLAVATDNCLLSVRRRGLALALLSALAWTTALPASADERPAPTAAATASPAATATILQPLVAPTGAAPAPLLTPDRQPTLIQPQAPLTVMTVATPAAVAPSASSPARPASSASVQPAASAVAPGTATAPLAACAEEIVKTARRLVGTPYRWGGTSPAGFDCSGFVWYVHKVSGRDL